MAHLLLLLVLEAEGCLNTSSLVQEAPPHIDVTDISHVPPNHIDTDMKYHVCCHLVTIPSSFTRSDELRVNEILENCVILYGIKRIEQTFDMAVMEMVTTETTMPRQTATSFLEMGRNR